jgi:hypothetical protein
MLMSDAHLSRNRDSPYLEGQVPVFISPRDTVVQLYSRPLSSLFLASYNSQGYVEGTLTRLNAGMQLTPVCSTRLVSSLYNSSTDHMENTASIYSSIACLFVAAETCLSSRYPAFVSDVTVTLHEPRFYMKAQGKYCL